MQTASLNRSERQTASERSLLLDFLRERAEGVGELISYEEFEAVLGRRLQSNRQPLYKAIEKLEKEHKRTLLVVENQGYRVAHPNECAGTVRRRIKRGERQITRGKKLGDNVDMAMLTPTEKEELYNAQRHITALWHEQRQLRKKLDLHDKLIADQAGTIKAHSQRLTGLEQQGFTADELAVLKHLAAKVAASE